MATILRLTNGAETIDLNDGEYYGLIEGWVPRVARRRSSELGGRSVFEDVQETIPIRISGSTEAEALAKLARIASALDRVAQFAQGNEIAPWVIEYQPEGSTLSAPVQALIVDTAAAGQDLIQLPVTFNKYIRAYEINPVYVPLTRRGLWLGEIQAAKDNGAENPSVITVDLIESLPVPGPTQIKLTAIEASTPLIDDAYILFTDIPPESAAGFNFAVYDYADMSSTEFAAEADTDDAIGGFVMQIDAATDQTGTITVSVGAERKQLYIFVAVRNNHATTTWKMRAVSGGYQALATRWHTIDASTTNPRIVALGLLSSNIASHSTIDLEFVTAGSVGTLDIGHVVVFPRAPNSQVIAIIGGDYSSAAYTRLINIDHQSLTALDPLLGIETFVV